MSDNGKKLDDLAVLELRTEYKDSIKHLPTHYGTSANWPKTGRSQRRDKGMSRGLRPGSNRAKIVEAWKSGITSTKEIAELLNINIRSVRTDLPKLERKGYIQGYIKPDNVKFHKKDEPTLMSRAIKHLEGLKSNASKDQSAVVEATLKSIYVVECPCCKAVIRVKGLQE